MEYIKMNNISILTIASRKWQHKNAKYLEINSTKNLQGLNVKPNNKNTVDIEFLSWLSG